MKNKTPGICIFQKSPHRTCLLLATRVPPVGDNGQAEWKCRPVENGSQGRDRGIRPGDEAVIPARQVPQIEYRRVNRPDLVPLKEPREIGVVDPVQCRMEPAGR